MDNIRLVWFPTWACQNYSKEGVSGSDSCPYCPYGMKNGELLFEDKPVYTNLIEDPEVISGFLAKNAAKLGVLDISGGEPLLYPHLVEVLSHPGLQDVEWAITSNTLSESAIDKLIASGVLARCQCWTASYHANAGKDDIFRRNIEKLSKHVKKVKTTIIVAESTIDKLNSTMEFVSSLPITDYSVHADCHDDESKMLELQRFVDERFPESKVATAERKNGKKTPIQCKMFEKLLALGPDGMLYNCVTHTYTNKDPICKVHAEYALEELEAEEGEYSCKDNCFAICDHIKHLDEEYHVLVLIPTKPNMNAELLYRTLSYETNLKARSKVKVTVVRDFRGAGDGDGVRRFDTRLSLHAQARYSEFRQGMIDDHLKPEHTHVLWIDADIIYPANLPELLLRVSKRDIVAPANYLEEQPNRWFDIRGFIEDGKPISAQPPYFKQSGELVSIDSVGACYMVPASVYRNGARYHPTIPGHVEHYSVCSYAREEGVRVLCHQGIKVYHIHSIAPKAKPIAAPNAVEETVVL